jgi:hypothetical protein
VTLVDNEVQFASGVCCEEVKEKLLDRMYDLLKKEQATANAEDSDSEGADEGVGSKNRLTNDKRPYGWYFQGWMAFLVLGRSHWKKIVWI